MSVGQLQQWRSPPPQRPGPPTAADALQGFSSEGRNTLIVHAAERALHETGTVNEAEAKRYRATLTHFADALLQQRPPISLDAFMERIESPDTAQRDAAAMLRAAYENGRSGRSKTRNELNACFRALSMVPQERRALTLGEVLLRMPVARALKTLLPAEDHGLLQQVQQAERPPNMRAALEKQGLLIRLGVALRAQGHGGLSGWLQMQRQPGGAQRADELLTRIRNGPELKLSNANKGVLHRAVAQLRACGPQQAGASGAADAPDDFPLLDPGTPTAGDLAFLGPVDDAPRDLTSLEQWLPSPGKD